MRYPPDWHIVRGNFFTYDPEASTGPPEGLPPGEIKVEVGIGESRGSSTCGGGLNLDETGEIESVEPFMSEMTLAGLPAWEIIREEPDYPLTLIRAISLVHQGQCIHLAAYFTQEVPDVLTFHQMAASFEINFAALPTARPLPPADWPTYERLEAAHSFQYPPGWHVVRGELYSYDAADVVAPEELPDGEVKIEILRQPAEGMSSCGEALTLDGTGAIETVDPRATETFLGELPAWDLVRDGVEPPLTLIREISLVQGGECVLLIAYFTQDSPDEEILRQIAASFKLHVVLEIEPRTTDQLPKP